MIQYGLRTAKGAWLPRDARKRSIGIQLRQPDLWQDQERAIEYASRYSAEVVAFVVREAVVQTNVSHVSQEEVVCGAV